MIRSSAPLSRTGHAGSRPLPAAAVVVENARLASSDLREVLGVLRDPENTDIPGLTRPIPSALETINLLVQESEHAGNPTTLAMTASASAHIEELSAPLRQHVNRIIQEGLTNARKHAPGEPITVHVDGNKGQRLTLALTNPLVATAPHTESTASGFGLMGLRERARIAGGDLTTEVTDGVFSLEAWFPWSR